MWFGLLLFITYKNAAQKTYIIQIQHTSKTSKKGEMQSVDKITIKAKVTHVYVSTTVLANNIQISYFIPRQRERTNAIFGGNSKHMLIIVANFINTICSVLW